MKKIIIVVAIILTSGLAAFALSAKKSETNVTTENKQTENSTAKVQDGDMRATLSNAD